MYTKTQAHNASVHLVCDPHPPPLISFFFLRLTFGAWYDFRIRRANRHIGVLQTKKAKVVRDSAFEC